MLAHPDYVKREPEPAHEVFFEVYGHQVPRCRLSHGCTDPGEQKPAMSNRCSPLAQS